MTFPHLLFNRQRQHGAFSVMAAFTILTLLMFLVLVLDSGRLYMEQRKLQKVADTAALGAILGLPDGNCSTNAALTLSNANANAIENNFIADAGTGTKTLSIQCAAIKSENNLHKAVPDNAGRAVEVTVTHNVPSSLVMRAGSIFNSTLSDEINLKATAVAARDEPVAVFMVGSQLLRLNNNKLLGVLLKTVGLDARTLSLLDSKGLADASITPSGLLKALGIKVGINELKALSPQGLVDLVQTQVGLLGIDRLLDVSLELVNDSVLKAELEALRLNLLSSPILRDLNLQLFATPDSPGILSLTTKNGDPVGAALDAKVNLGDILKTTILIGADGRGLHVPELNVLGLARIELGIVEPPSIGVGPVGTQAYSAQVRLYVNVDTSNLLGGALKWLTETILGTRINLPIWIDVVNAQGTLEEINCDATPQTAVIDVESRILNACVGSLPDELKWSGKQSCEAGLQEDELIKLLHIPVLSGSTHIPALRHRDSLTLEVGETQATSPNALALGNTVGELVEGLLDLLAGLFRPPQKDYNQHLTQSEAAQNLLIDKLTKQYLEETKVGGLYNVKAVTDLILKGGTQLNEDGTQLIPPLVESDWHIDKSIPVSCAVFVCPPSLWNDGNFSHAFYSYTSVPYALLDVVGIPTLGNGYTSCSGLLSSLLAWNACVEHNLSRLLKKKPGGVNLTQNSDGQSLADPNSDSVTCGGVLCIILKPVLAILKPILNSVGWLLTEVLSNVLGLELGRTDVTLHEMSCGTPRLIK